MNSEINHSFVGRNIDQVSAELKAQGTRYRVTQKDGENYIVTMDYVPERYNFAVKDGKIISVSMG